MNFKNISTTNIKILNFLVLFYPIALMTGNFLTNLNVMLVCILGIFLYRDKILSLDELKILFTDDEFLVVKKGNRLSILPVQNDIAKILLDKI